MQLSVFEVTTSGDVGYQSANAAEATRMNMPIENIPMNVTIYNQQFIEDLVATDTSMLLAYESSAVKTTENDGFMSRGSASVNANFLNGFAQTAGLGSQPLANVERVEVLRGPAAVLYGAGGYGGVVNRITKQPRTRPFHSTRVILSDEDSYRFELDSTGPLARFGQQSLLYRVNGIYERGETWFGQRKEEESIAPSLAWQITPKTKVIFEYFYNWRENQAGWETPMRAGDPYGIVTGDGVYRELPRRVNWVIPEDYRRNTRQVASYDLRHAFSDNLQFRSQFQYETRKQDNVETQAFSDALTILKDTALMPRLWRQQPRETDNYRSRNELVWNFEVLGTQHRTLWGHGWIEQYDLNSTYRSPRNNGGMSAAALAGNGRVTDAQAGPLFNSFPDLTYAQFLEDPRSAGYHPSNLLPMNLFERSLEPRVPSLANRPALALDTHTKTYNANHDFYFADTISFADDRFFLSLGARHSEFKRRTIAFASGTFPNRVLLASAPTVEQTADATTGSIGLVWHANRSRTLSFYGNLNNSFSPEFRSQPDGSDLNPEEGRQKEVGLRLSFLDGRILGLVTYFDLLQDNVTRADPAPGRNGYFIQESGQRSTGLEFNLNARITDRWLVFGGYTNTDARNEITGLAKDLQPRHRFTLFNRYNFTHGRLKGLGLSLGTIYQGERPITRTTARSEPLWGPLSDYWRVDAIVSYRLRPADHRVTYNVSFKVSNLLDERNMFYVAQNHRYTVEPGREWQLAIGARF